MLKAEQLSTAIGTRTLIGAAVGILMERYGMNQSAAFSYLTRQASTQNRKVRSVAQDLVDSIGERAPDRVDDRPEPHIGSPGRGTTEPWNRSPRPSRPSTSSSRYVDDGDLVEQA